MHGVDTVEVQADQKLATGICQGMLNGMCKHTGPIFESLGHSPGTVVASHALAHLMAYSSITMITKDEGRKREFLEALYDAAIDLAKKYGQADNN